MTATAPHVGTRTTEVSALDGRDPAVDLLRVGALAVVVLGHWLLAVVHWDDGSLRTRNLLDVAPFTQWATWPFQVMPLFFAVGGWASARSWTSRGHGRRWADWVAHRLTRLLVPAGTYVVAAAVVATTAEAAFGGAAAPVAGLLGMHLWFLAVYVTVTATIPWLCAQVAVRGWLVPAAFGLGTIAVDAVRFGLDVPIAGWANFAFVWLGCAALGVAAARRPPRRRVLWPVALVAASVLVVVVAAGWYPHSMVGVGDRSNNTPPTVALALLGLTQIALAAALAPRLRRWVEARPGARRAVEVAGVVGMHAYLWHLCATVVVVAAMQTGLGNITPLTGWWWASRPVWWAVLGLVATPIIVASLRFDLWRLRAVPRRGPARTGRVTIAVVVAATACTALSLGGVGLRGIALCATVALVVAPRVTRSRPDSDVGCSGTDR